VSKKEKLIEKLKRKPKDFTYQELRSLLGLMGYSEETKGKSSGSRVAWINLETKSIIRLHKPHPENTLKLYQISEILEELKKDGLA
jgi:hypothetical protein